MQVPEELHGRAVVVEAWGWLGSAGGFQVVGVTRPRGRYTEKRAGESGATREKAHILLEPGECEEVRIIRGTHMSGRWKVRFLDAMSVEAMPSKVRGGASRFFRCPARGTRIAAQFGDAGGRLGVYDERGRCTRVLAGRGHRFDDVHRAGCQGSARGGRSGTEMGAADEVVPGGRELTRRGAGG
ncbi:hypothetical protein ADL04_06930 [Streptomyces sp. NRRL B-3648]|nr:hypothetical protein ADL04_06930 [Streptomyces sp. NRRL B-3648]